MAPAAWRPAASVHFGRSGDHRVDDPAKEYGALYAAADIHYACIETYEVAQWHSAVWYSRIATRALSRIETSSVLRLVDLTGPRLARIAADARLTTGDSDIARRWARQTWDHPARSDGILYSSRHDPSRVCAALVDRAHERVDPVTLGKLVDSSLVLMLERILDDYGFAVVEDELP